MGKYLYITRERKKMTGWGYFVFFMFVFFFGCFFSRPDFVIPPLPLYFRLFERETRWAVSVVGICLWYTKGWFTVRSYLCWLAVCYWGEGDVLALRTHVNCFYHISLVLFIFLHPSSPFYLKVFRISFYFFSYFLVISNFVFLWSLVSPTKCSKGQNKCRRNMLLLRREKNPQCTSGSTVHSHAESSQS